MKQKKTQGWTTQRDNNTKKIETAGLNAHSSQERWEGGIETLPKMSITMLQIVKV